MCRGRLAAHINAASVRDRRATGDSKPTPGQDAVKSLAQLARARLRTQTHRAGVAACTEGRRYWDR